MQVLSYDITFHRNEWLPTGFPSHSWCKCQVTPDSDYVIHNDVWKQMTLTLSNFASQVNVSWIKVYVDICIRKQRYAFMFCSNESSFWHTLVIQTYSLSTWKITEIVSVIEAIVPACLWKWNRHGNSYAHKPWRGRYKYPYHPPNVRLHQITLYMSTLEYY